MDGMMLQRALTWFLQLGPGLSTVPPAPAIPRGSLCAGCSRERPHREGSHALYYDIAECKGHVQHWWLGLPCSFMALAPSSLSDWEARFATPQTGPNDGAGLNAAACPCPGIQTHPSGPCSFGIFQARP